MKTIRDLRTLLPWDCFPINNLVFQIIKSNFGTKTKELIISILWKECSNILNLHPFGTSTFHYRAFHVVAIIVKWLFTNKKNGKTKN
jgi:uncharacterized membrane protein